MKTPKEDPKTPVTIDDILAESGAGLPFDKLLGDGFPETLLREALVAFANGSDKRIDIVPGMSRTSMHRLAGEARQLAERIERANKSPHVDPAKISYPPNPWRDMSLDQAFLRLPDALRAYSLHIEFCLDRLPRTIFNSDRQTLKLALILLTERFTGRKHYEEIAELLTVSLRVGQKKLGHNTKKDLVIEAGRLAQQFRRNRWCLNELREQLEIALTSANHTSL